MYPIDADDAQCALWPLAPFQLQSKALIFGTVAHFTQVKVLDKPTSRSQGSIYTPAGFAELLTSWAIQKPNQKVLDLGIGEGAFAFAAYRRLLSLGATTLDAQQQLYGAEIDRDVYGGFLKLAKAQNLRFPNLQNADFFQLNLPTMDVVVGNPPYVRRTYLENADWIRRSVTEMNSLVNRRSLSRLTDLYVYFLLYGLSVLKLDGRFAAITADSWLNVRYGNVLKEYLLHNFKIEKLITLDRRVFKNVLVKPVMILATKTGSVDSHRPISFVRVKNGLPVKTIQDFIENPSDGNADIAHYLVDRSRLHSNQPWAVHFKLPQVYEKVASHALMTPVEDLAITRIGLQTLAKDFFVLSPEKARLAGIEPEYLEPIAQSAQYCSEPIIEPTEEPAFYVFYCSKSKEELTETCALKYIEQAESGSVQVRGKNTEVMGYHNKERIKRSSRLYWYDLKTSLIRRGRASILIPRLVYRTFTIVWNKANYVPGELFIEFLPKSETLEEVYLAILTSSVTEIMLRAHAQVYGGGTYNINPGQIKKVPILNANFLSRQGIASLRHAYVHYLEDKKHDRSVIDEVVYDLLGFDEAFQRNLRDVLTDLHLIATSSKKAASANP